MIVPSWPPLRAPTSLRPYTSVANPAPASATLSQETRPTWVSPTFFSCRNPPTVISAATGSTNRKTRRHEPKLRMTPDSTGPNAGATEIASIMSPMTRPRSCSGTTCISVVMSSGIITAVPAAWMLRATSSTSNVGAAAARAVPTRNVAIATV